MRLTSLALACSVLASTANAGGMGAVQASSLITPFMTGEASYTWSSIDGYNINVQEVGLFTSNKNTQGWGGRIGAGLLDKLSDRFSASAEMGWGYYGRVQLNPALIIPQGVTVIPSVNTNHFNIDQYGLDLLAGILYTRPKYDLFFKAGALFENLRVDAGMNFSELVVGNAALSSQFNGLEDFRFNLPQVLPEIKLGGGYHVTERTLVTLAWMHAFGSTFSLQAPNMRFNPTTQLGNVTVNLQSPTLNSILFGLEHRFA